VTTVLDGIVASIVKAGDHDSNATAAPVAILWPDPDDSWGSILPLIVADLGVLTVGPYDEQSRSGPAIWVRTQLVAAGLAPVVVRLPGVRRSELQGAEYWPAHLLPIAELQFRGQWWQSSSTDAWTPLSFLRSKNGLALPVSGDAATAAALPGALVELASKDVEGLRQRASIDSNYLNGLLVSDELRLLLRWMNDPAGVRTGLTPAEWQAFCSRCVGTFTFDPRADTPISAAARLGGRSGAWNDLWERFAETVAGYPALPALLDQAKPDDGGLFTLHPSSWPSLNRDAESAVRTALLALEHQSAQAATTVVANLERDHGERRSWLWRSPLADALEHLSLVATGAQDFGPTASVTDLSQWYASTGWSVDNHAVCAIDAARSQADRRAVLAALSAVYSSWVDRTARQLQDLVTSVGYPGTTGLTALPGTCVVFIDGLRLDLGHRLEDLVARAGSQVQLDHRIAAFPTVTPTGKPAVAPVTGLGPGPEFAAGDTQARPFVGAVFDRGLAAAGVEKLGAYDVGDTSGIGWTEAADIDSIGHAHGHALADRLEAELAGVAERIAQLLDGGWTRVVVVTDHGFLLSPFPLEKVELAQHLTENDSCRKPRVARLKAQAPDVVHPTVAWTWDSSVRMVSPPGASSFVAGRLYEHGGISLQECVTPVLTVAAGSAASAASITAVKWVGMRCRVDTTAGAGVLVELRRSPGDSTAAVTQAKPVDELGEVKLLVTDDHLEGTTVHVVLLDDAGTVLAQRATTVGGDNA
jgi:hypothetical protein